MPQKEYRLGEEIQWIDVIDSSTTEMEELSKKYRLDYHTARDCMQPEHLPKYEYIDDVHFLILRFYSHESDKSEVTIQEITNKIAIFYTDHFIITVHKAKAPFLDSISEKLNPPKECPSITDLVIKIIWSTWKPLTSRPTSFLIELNFMSLR